MPIVRTAPKLCSTISVWLLRIVIVIVLDTIMLNQCLCIGQIFCSSMIVSITILSHASSTFTTLSCLFQAALHSGVLALLLSLSGLTSSHLPSSLMTPSCLLLDVLQSGILPLLSGLWGLTSSCASSGFTTSWQSFWKRPRVVFITGPPAQFPAPPRCTAPGGPCFFRVPCPYPRPRRFLRRVPVKTGGEKWGPVQGMSGDSPQTGAEQGSPSKSPPGPVVRAGPGVWKPAPLHPVTNSTPEAF